jgi:hypothetical protein
MRLNCVRFYVRCHLIIIIIILTIFGEEYEPSSLLGSPLLLSYTLKRYAQHPNIKQPASYHCSSGSIPCGICGGKIWH